MCTFLTNQEINELCDGLIIEYIKSIGTMPEYVDIDAFATEFMHLKVRYEHFIKTDPPCLGCIGNGETGFAVVKDGRAACVFFEKNEIVLESNLRKARSDNRRRFTLAHEVSHIILEQYNPVSKFRVAEEGIAYEVRTPDIDAELAAQETQANMMAAALLLPLCILRKTFCRFVGKKKIDIYGASVIKPEDREILKKMADALHVSFSTLMIRLKGLNVFQKRELSEFINTEFTIGGDNNG